MENDKYDVYEGPNEIEKRSIQDPVHGLIRVRLNQLVNNICIQFFSS